MTTIVLGAGAMGSLVAGRLAAAGFPVVLLGRLSPHVERIADRGLRIESAYGAAQQVPLRVTADPVAVAAADTLIVLVKTWATGEALTPLAPYLPPAALVLTLQNGLGNRERVAEALPAHPRTAIAAGVTTDAALRGEPGTVHHTGRGETLLERLRNPTRDRVEVLAAMLGQAGFSARSAAEIEPALWRKTAINAAINGLTALAGVENGAIAADGELAASARAIAEEVAGVARASGYDIPDAAAATASVAAATARNRSSMLRDLETGKRTEVDAIHGQVVERARAAGMEAPLCATLAAIIRARERAAAQKGLDGWARRRASGRGAN